MFLSRYNDFIVFRVAFLVLCFLEPIGNRNMEACYSVDYPTLGRKGVLINIVGRYCRVLAQFRMFLSRYNEFYCFGTANNNLRSETGW